jgi:hypothetical protein
VETASPPGAFALVENGAPQPSESTPPIGPVCSAAHDLQADVNRVTGVALGRILIDTPASAKAPSYLGPSEK